MIDNLARLICLAAIVAALDCTPAREPQPSLFKNNLRNVVDSADNCP